MPVLTNNKTEVLVVGAGPTGLVAAIELARRSIVVRIVDKVLPRPYSESRAEGIHAKTLEIFERMGILPQIFKEGKILRGFSFFANGKRLGRISFKSLPTPHAHAILLPQSEIELILLKHLSSLGVEVERPVEVSRVRQDKESTFTTFVYPDGREAEIEARFLLAADGGHSTIRKELGLDFEGKAMQGAYVMDAEAEFGVELPSDEGNFVLGPHGFLVMGLRPDGLWRIALSLPQSDRRINRETPTIKKMQQIFDQDFPGLGARLKSTSWASAFFLSSRVVNKLREGRIFLLGDAAHVHSPVGGQGMNTGIQDAVNLAWKVALALQLEENSSSEQVEKLLDSYQIERYPVMRRLIEVTNTSTAAILVTNLLLVKLRNLALTFLTKLPQFQTRLISDFTGFEVHYPNSPIVSYDTRTGRLSAGQIGPDAATLLTSNENTRRWYEVWGSDPRYQLLNFSGNTSSANIQELKALREEVTRRYGRFIRPVLITMQTSMDDTILIDRYGEMHRRYGLEEGGLCLIRPNGYISFISRGNETGELFEHLDNLFGQTGMRPSSQTAELTRPKE